MICPYILVKNYEEKKKVKLDDFKMRRLISRVIEYRRIKNTFKLKLYNILINCKFKYL